MMTDDADGEDCFFLRKKKVSEYFVQKLHISSYKICRISTDFLLFFTKLFPKNDRKTFCSRVIMRLFRGADPVGGQSAYEKRAGRAGLGVWMMKKGESYA